MDMFKRVASFALVLIIFICSAFVGGFTASASDEAELYLIGRELFKSGSHVSTSSCLLYEYNYP